MGYRLFLLDQRPGQFVTEALDGAVDGLETLQIGELLFEALNLAMEGSQGLETVRGAQDSD